MVGAWCYPGQHHAALTFGTAIGSSNGSVEWANGMWCIPCIGGSMQHSRSPMIAKDDAVIGYPGTSASSLVVKIAHIANR
jgi:hypothetical protein